MSIESSRESFSSALPALSYCPTSKPLLSCAGAETGAGGRIRDTHATGTGSIMGAATAGYCVGNLLVEGYDAPWEDPSEPYPESLAPPLQVWQLGKDSLEH